MSRITHIDARQILDSRGVPTVEVEVGTDQHHLAVAAVPSGASTGTYEACELRDGGSEFHGKGVANAVRNVTDIIKPKLIGMDARDQASIDSLLIEIDGTDNKSHLGANAILGTSLAVCRAGAMACRSPLYQYIGGIQAARLPVPFVNVLNGGAHADNNVDFQEFMIAPVGAESFSDAMRWVCEIFMCLKDRLKSQGLTTAVGDEGGFAPNLESNAAALDIISAAISQAGYKLGEDICFALDIAASEFYDAKSKRYCMQGGKEKATSEDMIHFYQELKNKYPIISLEDPLHEEDWDGFSQLTGALGGDTAIIGDDLFVTNPRRLDQGIKKKAANSVLVKLNQIGTLTETMHCIETARQNQYGYMISHRSGETEDTFIADLAVATQSGQIKTGSVSRTDRLCKYNRLLKIEKDLGSQASYHWSH